MRLFELLLLVFLLGLFYYRVIRPFLVGYREINRRVREFRSEGPTFYDDEEKVKGRKRADKVETDAEKIDRSQIQDAEFRDVE